MRMMKVKMITVKTSTYQLLMNPYPFRSSRPEVFCEKGVLRNFAKFTRNNYARVSFLKACNFIKKETLAQLLSCELCKIS